ncbi:MAG: tRNA uridine-5-carboxymethylaminomethyl(34) synthesis GTPase MnmE [Synergistaceae bacterium]|nr:tRNA uridine-5-carboxymethylaminomethyl(34) synthesis GTPase MnmE [Synergistaceae bacterium]
MTEDIITATATAWGEGGIAIVRLSGEGCAALVDKIFHGKRLFSEQPPRYMALGALRSAAGEAIDEALSVRFEKNASYTGEESAEIHCHGGALAAQRCVEELCALGARIALPGEFTRRAFVNGRIDLAQAEAVLGIIKARSDEGLRASARSLQGGLTEEIRNFMERLTELTAALEVDLDFPEEGEGFISGEESLSRMAKLADSCRELISRCRSGMLLREGVRAAIAGAPNVGKSSLLNALLNENRAIVTATPGTTRDSIEETFIHKGVPVRIIDTAGIRETEDEIEAIGVRRSFRSIEEADIVLWLIDGSSPEALDDAPPAAAGRLLLVVNKNDLPQAVDIDTLREKFPNRPLLSISAATGDGVDELKELIVTSLCGGENLSGCYAVTARQMECLTTAGEAIKAASAALASASGDDLTLSALADARAALSALLGIDASEDLLDKVFGSFCVGK